jgi:hypothetical protein
MNFRRDRANMARLARDGLRWISQNPYCTARDGLAQTGRQLATSDFVKIITKPTLVSSKFAHSKVGSKRKRFVRRAWGWHDSRTVPVQRLAEWSDGEKVNGIAISPDWKL